MEDFLAADNHLCLRQFVEMYNASLSGRVRLGCGRLSMHARIRSFKMWKLIERENAVRYMLISLLSFVATVSVVRTFLALAGYPQIGSGTLHIAHVLWGGLVLYIAAILPLIYLNPRLHTLCAVLSGVGVGLFIDEVGKFITRQYDYFFPAAAPIMYVFFLLLVILIVMIRRPEAVNGRAELVQALEIVREQLYRPLEDNERAHVENEMVQVLQNDPDKLHQDLAQHLLDILHGDPRIVPAHSPGRALRIAKEVEGWFIEPRLVWILGVGMLVLAVIMLKNPFQAWLEQISPGSALLAFLQAHAGRQLAPSDSPLLFNIRLGLEIIVGLLLFVAFGLLAAGRKRLALSLTYFSLLVSLAVLDMLLFYFEQFSTVLTVGFQFLLLFGVIYYRRRFIPGRR